MHTVGDHWQRCHATGDLGAESLRKQYTAHVAVGLAGLKRSRELPVQAILNQMGRSGQEKVAKLAASACRVLLVDHHNLQLGAPRFTNLLCKRFGRSPIGVPIEVDQEV